MIDLYNGEFLDLLPVSWRRSDSDAYLTQEDIDSLSYALKWCTQTLVDAAKRTRTQSMIDDLPERILDILAVELRAPYYSQTLPLETKRTIIKSTVRWHMHAGTPSAVRELMQVVFGDGEVIENWDFDDGPGEPYTFDLITGAPMRTDSRYRLLEMMDRVKNVRSHLRRIIYRRKTETGLYIGTELLAVPFIKSVTSSKADKTTQDTLGIGVGARVTPRGTASTSAKAQTRSDSILGLATGAKSVPGIRAVTGGTRRSTGRGTLGLAASAKRIPVLKSSSRFSVRAETQLQIRTGIAAIAVPVLKSSPGGRRVGTGQGRLSMGLSAKIVRVLRSTTEGSSERSANVAPGLRLAAKTVRVLRSTTEGSSERSANVAPGLLLSAKAIPIRRCISDE